MIQFQTIGNLQGGEYLRYYTSGLTLRQNQRYRIIRLTIRCPEEYHHSISFDLLSPASHIGTVQLLPVEGVTLRILTNRIKRVESVLGAEVRKVVFPVW